MKHLLSIFILLLALCCCTTEAERNSMRAGLDSINQRNRNDQPFTVKDVEPCVRFFDDHGTPNDRLLAHYLLGRAYYEAGEAPMALECYQKAVECADTTSKDCNYKQLCRVYAQMAQIFYEQGLYKEQLEHDKYSTLYAWKGKDTLAALMCYEQEAFAFSKLNLSDSVIKVIEDVTQKYELHGYPSYSAISLGIIIRTLVDKGDYRKAKAYMDTYEYKSGLFDSLGNIEKGREVYYKAKGLYYLNTNRYDSAEYYFRKELRVGKDFNNQNAAAMGLAMLYKRRHQADSAAKYSMYAYAMNDSVYAKKATETVERVQAVYDYSRHQKKAQEEREKTIRRTIIIWICVGIIFFLCVAAYTIYKNMKSKRREIEYKYLQSLETIRQARMDIEKLKTNKAANTELINEKMKIIHKQEDFLRILSKEPLIYKKMTIKGKEPSIEEWSKIKELLFALFPQFQIFMENNSYLLNDKEYKTCILIYAGFKPQMISNMLEVDPSYISKIRREMLERLFGKYGSPKDFDNAIRNV